MTKPDKSHREKWYRAMRRKLGVQTNAEVRAWMKKQGAKADVKKRTEHAGFAHMKEHNPERLKELSKQGADKRWHAKDN